MVTLGSPHPKAGTYAAQVISSIAAIEIPSELWPDLITQLLAFASDQGNVGLRMNSLTTIGQICEVVVRIIDVVYVYLAAILIYVLRSHQPR